MFLHNKQNKEYVYERILNNLKLKFAAKLKFNNNIDFLKLDMIL